MTSPGRVDIKTMSLHPFSPPVRYHHYRGLVFEEPTLSSGRFLTVAPRRAERHPIPGAGVSWDQERFGTVHPAAAIGRTRPVDPGGRRVLDLPIKVPGMYKAVVPLEAAPAMLFVLDALSSAAASHPKEYEQSYAYLTIDDGVVLPGSPQRNPGLHVDGFQGQRVGPALPSDFSYIVWHGHNMPTHLYPYGFDLRALDRGRHDINRELELQRQENHYQPVICLPGIIYGLSAYSVHAAGTNRGRQPLRRVFMRLSFSVRQFDRLGNTQSPFLNLDWDMTPRQVHDQLQPYR